MQRKKRQESRKVIRQDQSAIAALKEEGPWAKECEWPLEPRNGPELTASKEMGASFL